MGIATLREFTLHLDGRRLTMQNVSVVRVYPDVLGLVGTVKREEMESLASSNLVFKKESTEERTALIRLVSYPHGQVRAYERGEELGEVIWDNNTNARKLPQFMRRLLNLA